MRARDLESAEGAIQKALEIDPGYLPARKTEVVLQILNNNPQRAMQLAQELQKQYPDLAMGYELMGDILLQAGDLNGASQAYKSAFERAPDTELLLDRARVERASGRSDSAFRLLSEWLDANPGDHRVRSIVASIHFNAGRLEPALEHYEALAAQQPDDASAHNNLAIAYQKMGDSRALEYARRAYEMSPLDPAVNDTLGWILVQNGEAKEALEYLRQAQAREFSRPEVRYHLALALHQLGRDDEAEEELKAALASEKIFVDKPKAQELLAELQRTK